MPNKNNDNINKKINPVPKPETNIGIDISDEFVNALKDAATSSAVDISAVDNFSQISQNRETLYNVLDTMGEDSTISAALEIYAEDATETNDSGDIVWAESSDDAIGKYISFLLDSLNVDKNIYRWTYSFIKYGDLYLRLYRQSDFEDHLLNDEQKTPLNEKFSAINDSTNINEDLSNRLEEDAKIVAYKDNDKLVNYIEMVPNPAEMFELTRFGKSYAYIKTNTMPTNIKNDLASTSYYLYKFKQKDVKVYNAVSFVHAALQDDTPRVPEQVQIAISDINDESYTYSVRRGQSILYKNYRIWRQMMLLDNALLLNRLTKSSLLRVVEVEVGDMPKERMKPYLQRIKNMMEQKSSIDTNNKMTEYTNPGAVENNIYVPTKNGIGSISTQQIGGDVNVRDIADIDYFHDKLSAGLKIPKQYLGDTDDATGFNGGTSLSIISSRYAKTIKRIQATMIQAITDAINILLVDRGLDSYINKFSIRMQTPVTQEELDKRENDSSKIGMTQDIMNMLDGIEDEALKLKILKSLLSNSISNNEVITLLQDQIDDLEKQNAEEPQEDEMNIPNDGEDDGVDNFNLGSLGVGLDKPDMPDMTPDENPDESSNIPEEPDMETTEEGSLPAPSDLDIGDVSEQ